MSNFLQPRPRSLLMSSSPQAAPLAAPAQPAAPETGYRSVVDPKATRKAIFDNVRDAARSVPEISNQRHILRLKDVDYDEDPAYDYTQQKRAILANKHLSRRLVGTWELADKASGQVLDSRRMTVAQVPYMTERGTFINNGLEYIVKNQMRLRPGVFARIKSNGEIESHANIMPGKGVGHRYFLDPAKNTFYLSVHQAKIPLMPLMRALGATDKQLIEAWGPKLFEVNQQTDGIASVNKLYDKLIGERGKETDPGARRQAIAEAFRRMEVDPEVMSRTLGKPYKNLDLDAVLDATKKLLAISRGEQDVDDRDHMAYQTIHGVEDLMAERISRDFGNLRRKLLYKASFKGNLKPVPPSALTKQINAVLLSSGLGQPLEELNPAEILDKQTAITRLGVGGIGDTDAIPRESRSVQPSHYGYLDLVRTPESLRAGVDVYLGAAVRKGKDGRIYSPFRDARTGQIVYKSPQELADLTVAFPGELNRKTKRIGAMRGGKMDFYPRNEIDLIQDNFENSFSPLAQFVLGKSAMKAQRMSMGSRMSTQAVSLAQPEAPLVQVGTLDPDKDESFEERYAPFMGAVRASKPGRVVKVLPDRMDVRYEDGTQESLPLYNNFVFNRKSVTGSTEILIRRADGQLWRGPIAEYEWFSGDCTVSHDPETCCTAWRPVTGFIGFQSDKKLLRVKTRSGRFVDITEDHSLVTLDSKGSLVPITAAECTPGKTKLPLTVRLFRNERNFAEHATRQGILVGLYLAEGHIADTGLISISCDPPGRRKEIMGLLHDLGVDGYENGGNICFTDAVWKDFLQRNCGRLAHNKFASTYLLGLSGAFRRGIISGYLSGDGNMWSDTNGTPQVTGVSVSRTLRNNLVDILNSLGMFCTLFDAPRQHLADRWRDAYGFRISNSYLKSLPPIFYSDRQKSLQGWLRKDTRSSLFEMIPLVRLSRQDKKGLYKSLSRDAAQSIYQAVHLGAVSKKALAGSSGPFGRWGKSDIVWDEIESIEPIPEEEFVYDLSVEGSETFAVNNGLLVHNSYIHNTPLVRPGDVFKPNQLLAKSNYTDDRGATALGANFRTGYMPYKGYNFEDAIVISKSAAKRLSSEHAYQHALEKDEDIKSSKRDYLSLFPGKYERKILDRMDEDGVIKEGQTIHYGEPLLLAARRRDDAQNKLHKKKQSSYTDVTELWEHHAPGVVTDVVKTDKGTMVVVKSTASMQVGDKLSGRFGDKGVIAAVIDDDRMPKGEDGRPLEVLANDLGIISRANPIQLYEAILGTIARKTGQPIKLKDFSDIGDLNDWVMKQAKLHNINPLQTITDPENGRQIPNIMTGERFFMKLSHMADDKLAGRATGGYTANETPAKGGAEGSKALSLLDVNALLSHGAVSVIRDAGLIRGQKNDDAWLSVMRGHSLPKPKVPYVHQKFVNSLRAAGINVLEDGPRTHIMAMTDKDVDRLAGDRYITSGETVDYLKGLKPIAGGLFDEKLTGAHHGDRWAAIKLQEPLPNPVMEEPIRRMLGLTQKKFEAVLAGQEKLPNGLTGPSGLKAALDHLDLDKELAKARQDFAGGKMTKRDDAIRRMKYLKSAQKLGLHPRDWMLSKVPVLPPRFRPISLMSGNGLPLVADANYLYKELIEANDNLRNMTKEVDDVGDERLALYHAFRAVTGLGDPTHPKLQEKRVKGVLSHVFGGSPKTGAVQRKLISSTVDLVGRAVITPNPDYDMDTVGIPEDKAWNIYKPFVVRRLVRRGMKLVNAMQAVADRTQQAQRELVSEMDDRPVIINRAPVLHRFGIMAFRPRIVQGSAMQISPLVVKGFNADFDGDAMQFHVPADEEAVQEAYEKMLPSKNLISPANFKSPVHYPTNEYTGGLYVASTRKSKRSLRTLRNWQDALAAYRRGDLNIDDEIEVLT